MLALLDLNQLGTQHAQAVFLVLQLASLGLAGYNNAGCLVNQSNRRRGLIDVLTACTGRTVNLHFVIIRLDLKVRGGIRNIRNDLYLSLIHISSCRHAWALP